MICRIFYGTERIQNVQYIHLYKNMDLSLIISWHVVLTGLSHEFCDN